MGFRWNCLESLTGIGIGVASIGAATFLPGAEIGVASAATGAVIGGAGLLARIKENGRKAGLEDENLIARMQAKLLRDLDHWDQREEREAGRRADAAMTRLLPQVMLSRQELAATALECRGAEDRYPAIAAQRVVDELARHDDLFRAPPAGLPESFERQFARDAVTAALLAAKEDPQYAALMTLDVAIELGAAIRETIDAVQSLHDKVECGFAALQDELAAIRAEGRSDDAKLARLSEKAIRGAIARFIAFSPRAGTEEIVEAVESFAEDYAKLRGRVRELDAHDNRVRGLQQAADQALDDGDLDEGRRLLREASAVRVDAASEAVRAAAATLARLAEADLVALEWESAAVNWRSAAAMLMPFDADAAGNLHNTAGIALCEFEEKFAGGASNAAIAAFQAALDVRTRTALPAQWAATQNNLGNALSLQGQRSGAEAGIALQAEAVAAYRAALEVRTRDALPAQWAMTQNNLGIALWVQRMRSGGAEGIALLAEAVAAFRAALEVCTRDAQPAQWAMMQNNLGNALSLQGEPSGGEAGIALPAEAVAAYRAAQEVLTRDTQPAQWAMTQESIAIALVSLAETDVSNRCHHYRAAREAVSLALEIYTPEHLPFYHERATRVLARIEAAIAEHCPPAS